MEILAGLAALVSACFFYVNDARTGGLPVLTESKLFFIRNEHFIEGTYYKTLPC